MEIAYLAPNKGGRGGEEGVFQTTMTQLGRFLRDVSFLGCRSRMRLAHVNAY